MKLAIKYLTAPRHREVRANTAAMIRVQSMHLPVLFALLLAPLVTTATSSPGCNNALPSDVQPGAPSQNRTINSHGVQRTYLLHLPASYQPDRPVPLYFSFAGANRNASEQEGLSQFSNPEFNPNGIAVYPQGLNDHWLSNPDVDENAQPTDIDFTLDLLDSLEQELCIDADRVYAAGKSNGGGLVNLLACNSTSAGRFAAFASVSGAYYEDRLARDCAPQRVPVPFLEFHGVNDTTVPYVGKNGSDDAQSEYAVFPFVQTWAERNGCPQDAPATDMESLYSGEVTRFSWSCDGNVDVVQHYREDDLGHIWPSTVLNDDCQQIPKQCPEGHYVFNATSVIFDFFERWTLPGKDDC